MTIATEINRLQIAKNDIKSAIEAKGVTVGSDLKLDAYPSKIAEITTGGGSTWTQPSDWLDITDCGNNEIYFLVTNGIFAFCTYIDGTYDIDWGDGTTTTSCSNGVVYEHEFLTGGTYSTTQHYYMWKVKIHNATNVITKWEVQRNTIIRKQQDTPILWVNFGTSGITSYLATFTKTNLYSAKLKKITLMHGHWGACITASQFASNCYGLVDFDLPSDWGLVTNTSNMFNNCPALNSVTLPTSWGLVNNCSNMFFGCRSLAQIVLPDSWGDVTSCAYMFNTCNALNSVTLPTTWGKVTNCSFMFSACEGIVSIKLPSDWSGMTHTSYMFNNCYSLSNVDLPKTMGVYLKNLTLEYMFKGCIMLTNFDGLQYLGSQTVDCAGTDMFRECEYMQGTLTINSRLTRIGVYGSTTCQMKLTGLRLTNANSGFGGASPQVDVSYTNLNADALNTLFNDLPPMTLQARTIKITGCVGAVACNKSIANAKNWTVLS